MTPILTAIKNHIKSVGLTITHTKQHLFIYRRHKSEYHGMIVEKPNQIDCYAYNTIITIPLEDPELLKKLTTILRKRPN